MSTLGWIIAALGALLTVIAAWRWRVASRRLERILREEAQRTADESETPVAGGDEEAAPPATGSTEAAP